MTNYSVRHIAIIPDGNRRWAKKRNLAQWRGHAAGAKAFRAILRKALAMNVFCISFWGMSLDNLSKREQREVKFLLQLFKREASHALENRELRTHDVRVVVVGEWMSLFPKNVSQAFERVVEKTKHCKRHVLNFLLAYDGKHEMKRAIELILARGKGDFTVKDFLYTKDLPPVDLVIRTGGEPHLSGGFMMWDTADAQLHFFEKLWPDFTPRDFEFAVEEYLARERRFGK